MPLRDSATGCVRVQALRRNWHWVVTFSTFIQYFLSVGFLHTYSILYLSLQEEFNSSAALTGWLGAVANALSYLLSPLTAVIERKLGNRTVVLIGVSLFCAGLLVTSFLPALGYAYLTFGVLTGVGGNIMKHSPMVLLMEWAANRNFSRAIIIAQFGSTCGMLAFSPLVTLSIDYYGWRDALKIITGGIFVVGFVTGVLLTNPPTECDTETPDEATKETSSMESEAQNMVEMNEVRVRCTANGEVQIVTEDEVGGEENDNPDVSSCRSPRNVDTCRAMLAMMKSLDPWLWFIGVVLAFMGWTFFIISFGSYMKGLEFRSDQIAWGVAVFALGDLAGKILLAVIGDRLPVMYLYVLVGSCLLATVAVGLLTVAKTYLVVIFLALASGFVRSGVNGGLYPAGAELFRKTYGSGNSMVMCLLPIGVGYLFSAPLSGVLYDLTGNFILSLLVIIATFICASAAFICIPLWKRIRSRDCCCSSKTRPVQI